MNEPSRGRPLTLPEIIMAGKLSHVENIEKALLTDEDGYFRATKYEGASLLLGLLSRTNLPVDVQEKLVTIAIEQPDFYVALFELHPELHTSVGDKLREILEFLTT